MATIQNDRDVLLQAAGTRVLSVTLPSNVTVPPARLGSGALPSSVLTPSGSTFGALAAQNTVNLGSQVVGTLPSANISGLGALALLNVVDANTQVNNLGNLAYVDNLAANQIGAGTLAAGVIYAGNINANQITAGTISGRDIVGGNQIFIAGTGIGSPVGIYATGGTYGVVHTKGELKVETAAGVNLLSVYSSEIRVANAPFTIDSSTLQGSMGSRILLKNVAYTATINGTPSQTITITA